MRAPWLREGGQGEGLCHLYPGVPRRLRHSPAFFLGGKSQAVVELWKPSCVPSRPSLCYRCLLLKAGAIVSHFKDCLVYPYKDFLGRRPAACSQRNETGCHHGHPAHPPSRQGDAPTPGSNYPWWGWPHPFCQCLQAPSAPQPKAPLHTAWTSVHRRKCFLLQTEPSENPALSEFPAPGFTAPTGLCTLTESWDERRVGGRLLTQRRQLMSEHKSIGVTTRYPPCAPPRTH